MAIAICNLTGLAYLEQGAYGDSLNPDLRYVFGLWADLSQFVFAVRFYRARGMTVPEGLLSPEMR